MSNLALWSRPAWDTDRWLRDFFGPAAATDWVKPTTTGFNPAAEVVKDGDDAIVRVELPGVDVEKDVNVEVDRGRQLERPAEGPVPDLTQGAPDTFPVVLGVLTVRVTGAYAGSRAQRIAITK